MSHPSGADRRGIQQMPKTVISCTAIEFHNEEMIKTASARERLLEAQKMMLFVNSALQAKS